MFVRSHFFDIFYLPYFNLLIIKHKPFLSVRRSITVSKKVEPSVL